MRYYGRIAAKVMQVSSPKKVKKTVGRFILYDTIWLDYSGWNYLLGLVSCCQCLDGAKRLWLLANSPRMKLILKERFIHAQGNCYSGIPSCTTTRLVTVGFFSILLARTWNFITIGNTLTNLVWQLFHDYMEAANHLKIDQDLVTEVKAKFDKLKPLHINQDGRIKEWYEE